jgi:hypothetical protein
MPSEEEQKLIDILDEALIERDAVVAKQSLVSFTALLLLKQVKLLSEGREGEARRIGIIVGGITIYLSEWYDIQLEEIVDAAERLKNVSVGTL